MLELLTLAPTAGLAAAALIGRFPRLLTRPRPETALNLALGFALLAALAALAALRLAPATELSLSGAALARGAFRDTPSLALDLSGALASGAICLGALAAILAARLAGSPLTGQAGALLIAAASCAFVAASASPLGLVTAWLLLDAALFVGGALDRRGLLTAQAGLLLALAALAWLPLGTPLIQAQTLDESPRLLLLLAASIRMGLFPFWWAIPRTPAGRAWTGACLRLGPTIAGAALAMRLVPAEPASTGPVPLVAGPALLAILGGALFCRTAIHRSARLDWLTTYQAGFVLFAPVLGGTEGMRIGLIALIDLALTAIGQYAGADRPGLAAARLARLAAAASLANLPPATGFLTRWLLYGALVAGGRTGLVLLLSLAAIPVALAFVVPSLRERRPADETGRAPEARGLAAILVLGAALQGLLGLGLLLGARFGGPRAGWEAVWPMPQGAWIAGALLLPTAAALAWQRLRRTAPVAPEPAWARALRLTELFDQGRGAAIRLGETAQWALGLVGERRTMAWTLLGALVTGAIFLGGSAWTTISEPGQAPASAGGPLAALVAIGIAATMLLVRLPLVHVLSLLAAYLFSAALLVLTPNGSAFPMAVVATIKAVAGGVVVAILAISAVQAPAGGVGVPDRRRARFAAPPGWRAELGLPALALAIAVLIALGIPSRTLPEAWPPQFLHAVLILVIGGVLTVVFAGGALQLAAGLLLALCGLELAYARIDAGLLITGGLALFQLLLVTVISIYFDLPQRAARGGA